METLIVVPARFGSTRFPGKPLAEINGVSIIRRTAEIAARACREIKDSAYVIATDHEDILSHCKAHDILAILTSSDLASGSDRARAAYRAYAPSAQIIVNLQGDAPFTDVAHIRSCVEAMSGGVDVATPYVRLSWEALDILRGYKQTTPFSGTTLIHDASGRALWFSKTIIPVIKHEASLRTNTAISPVCRHIGLYVYTADALERYIALPRSYYEKLEDLEQLRMIESGFNIAAVAVEPAKISTSGIDSPEDLTRVNAMLRQFGDPFEGSI